jgi:hypothetical protein
MTANDPYTRPNADTAALILIDVQRGFIDTPDTPGDDAPMPVAGTRRDPGDGAAGRGLAATGTAHRARGPAVSAGLVER